MIVFLAFIVLPIVILWLAFDAMNKIDKNERI